MSRGEWKIHCFINIYSKLLWVYFLSPMRFCLDTRFTIHSITNAERTILSFWIQKKFNVIRTNVKKRKSLHKNIAMHWFSNFFLYETDCIFLFPRLFKVRENFVYRLVPIQKYLLTIMLSNILLKIFSVILLQDNWKLQKTKPMIVTRRVLI